MLSAARNFGSASSKAPSLCFTFTLKRSLPVNSHARLWWLQTARVLPVSVPPWESQNHLEPLILRVHIVALRLTAVIILSPLHTVNSNWLPWESYALNQLVHKGAQGLNGDDWGNPCFYLPMAMYTRLYRTHLLQATWMPFLTESLADQLPAKLRPHFS